MARSEYYARIHRVIDHIETHLDQELSVDGLAAIGCFSPYHFHRVFGAVVGEPLMGWFPSSGWQPDVRPCFELHLNDPATDPEGLHRLELWESARPL